jgi:hypothetical protein
MRACVHRTALTRSLRSGQPALSRSAEVIARQADVAAVLRHQADGLDASGATAPV